MMHRARVAVEVSPLGLSVATVEAAVTDRVRRAILTGELAPGTRMLQAELAARMSVSITPIRAALRQLAGEGLIHIEARRAVSVHRPTPEELREVYEIRTLLEPVSVKKAAKKITDAELAAAEGLLDGMDSAATTGEWDVLNRDFHALLVEASGSPRLTTIMLGLLSLATIGIRSADVLTDERMREANVEHRQILAACRARDPEAARAMTLKHLRSTAKIAAEAGLRAASVRDAG
jgi:DNA-binding GntR family transcriptional regulator